VLRATGSLNSRTIPHALTGSVDDATVDLGNATFLEPIGLVAVAALTDRAVREGKQVRFTRPSDFGVRNYCARIGLGKHLESLFVSHDLPTVQEKPHPDELLELRQFSSEFDGEQLARLVYDRVSDDGSTVDAQVPDTLFTSIRELAANVSAHAKVPPRVRRGADLHRPK
jgi:hypothetical protein